MSDRVEPPPTRLPTVSQASPFTQLRHDLRTCIDQILGYSEILQEDAEEGRCDRFIPDLESIQLAGRRLLELLDGLFADAPSGGWSAAAVSGHQGPEADESRAAPGAAEEASSASLLVVDDDQMSRDMLSRRLGGQGHRVEAAASGREALRRLERGEIDLVLLDIMMPDLSGLQVLERLRRRHSITELPVIMVSAKEQSEDVVEALRLGANDYVTKPVDLPVLRARIRTHLTLKRVTGEVRCLARQLELRSRFIRQVFGRYLTDDVVASLLETPRGLQLGGEKRRVTIAMADLCGFTSLAERLAPEQVVAVINNFLGVMTEVIVKHGGTIDEFIGDAILVLFGAPEARPDHARAAAICSVEMQLAMEEVNRRNRDQGLPEVEMGIGVHTGDVVVGNIGSERRAKYGVVGSNVNLTARIESYALGGQILISPSTRSEAGPILRIDGEMEIHPKGVDRPITVYRLGGLASAVASEPPATRDDHG